VVDADHLEPARGLRMGASPAASAVAASATVLQNSRRSTLPLSKLFDQISDESFHSLILP
jgi:hypothetical protein